ncbi:MAG: hypothetical protein EBZ05_08175 [Verrucomicrobia bacterium]|nr:hypothetical protein [Verrucomicrobiota bacterium]
MMNQFLKVYLKENFGVRAEFLRARKTGLRPKDVVLHNGALPLKHFSKGSCRLVVFHSGLDPASKLLWISKGATGFLSLSDSLSEIHKCISLIL